MSTNVSRKLTAITLVLLLITMLGLSAIQPAQAAFTFSGLGGGVNGPVYAIAYDNVNGYVYVGGAFTQAGGTAVSNIARWNGSSWNSLGGGVNGPVYALLANPTTEGVLVGGVFTERFVEIVPDGSNWIKMEFLNFSPLNGSVFAIARKTNGAICIGGDFTQVAGIPVGRVICEGAMGSTDTLNSGVNGVVRALTLDNSGNLLIGGSFNATTSGQTMGNIVRWVFSSGTWQAIGTGLGNSQTSVNSIVVDASSKVYAAFNSVDPFGWGVGTVQCFDGSAWTSLTSSGWSSLGVYALAWDGRHNLYAGGYIDQAGGNTVYNLVRYDGANWSGVGNGINDTVRAIALSPMYASGHAGGFFTQAGSQTVNRITSFYDVGLAATETAAAGATQTAIVRTTQTAIAIPTQTTAARLTQTVQGGATQTAQAVTATAQIGATQTAQAATATTQIRLTQTAQSATATAQAGATQTAQAATTTMQAGATQTAQAATATVQTGATQTVQAATATAQIRLTQTAIAATTTAAAWTHTPTVTPTVSPNLTATARAVATQTAQAATATAQAVPPTPTLTPSVTPTFIAETQTYTVYLSVIFNNHTTCSGSVRESEPNNTASEADLVCVEQSVTGTHDGDSGTGDLFKINLSAGQTVNITLSTASDLGVQLLVYRDANGTITLEKQDTTSPFQITYVAPATGWYLIYVYSDPEDKNTASYSLTLAHGSKE